MLQELIMLPEAIIYHHQIYLFCIRTMSYRTGSKIYTTMDIRSLPDTQTMVSQIHLRATSSCANF